MSLFARIRRNDRYASFTWNVSRSADFGSDARIQAAFAKRAAIAFSARKEA